MTPLNVRPKSESSVENQRELQLTDIYNFLHSEILLLAWVLRYDYRRTLDAQVCTVTRDEVSEN